ncbi:MAG: hypothetical protein R3F13_13525 [Prosthecobacter sp.]
MRLFSCCLLSLFAALTAMAGPIEGITFAAEQGKVFLPVDEALDELKWPVRRDDMGLVFQINETPLRSGSLRRLTDGTELVDTNLLAEAGAEVSAPDENGRIRVPLTDGNPAKFFYEWVQSGTPVSVTKD